MADAQVKYVGVGRLAMHIVVADVYVGSNPTRQPKINLILSKVLCIFAYTKKIFNLKFLNYGK